MSKTEQRFTGVLERSSALGWTVLPVPFVPSAVWPSMLRLRVEGTLEGPNGSVRFRSSLFPSAAVGATGSQYVLFLSKAILASCGLGAGAKAEICLAPDLAPRPAELPNELDLLLDEAEGLRSWYEALSEAVRRELGKWIGIGKTDQARQRRAEQMAERLLNTMEAERELPPMMERAFRLRPKARDGWGRMTPVQRRNELMAVFYYQSPEAQAKRLEKLLQGAEKRAGG